MTEVIAALMLIAGGVLAGGMFGATTFALLFGAMRLNTKFATNLGAIAGATLGVWFAFVIVQGWDDTPTASSRDIEQVDEDRWLRP